MKTTKATEALTGLQWAIQQTVEKPRQPDEFTASDVFNDSDRTVPLYTIQRRLKELFDIGKCTRRKMGKDWLYLKS